MTKQNNFLIIRARVVQAIRAFFIENGYLEVETPIRIPAPIPEAHINGFESEGWYLHASPEICMKRLAARGHEKIFQICKCFRKEEVGDLHLTEMTLLEWYTAGHTYRELMAQTAALLRYVARKTGKGNSLNRGREIISLEPPWQEVTVADAFEMFAPVSLETALRNDTVDEVMAFDIEPRLGLGKPTFIYDYPASMGALARKKPDNPALAERFELYIAGVELANGFSELTDPKEQRCRFQEEIERRKAGGQSETPMPHKFLAELAHLPDTAGIAVGIDRLVMLFADADTIDQVVTFTPQSL